MKDIPGYEGLYAVSRNGQVFSKRSKRFLKPAITLYGYLKVELCNNGIGRGYPVHRLVAMAYIPNMQNKGEVNHINGIKTDNQIENLEWVTHKENIWHSYQIGLRGEGFHEPLKKHNLEIRKLTIEQALVIRRLYKTKNYSQRKLARMFNISRTIICGVLRNKTYKEATLIKENEDD